MRPAITTTQRPARLAVLAAALLGLLLLAGAEARAEPVPASKEYELKAAFLYNFAKFVAWPSTRLPDPASPIVIGLYGRSPFGTELGAAIAARKVGGRAIVLREVTEPEQLKDVHLLFIPAAADRELDLIMPAVRERAILTVGESEAFQDEGGIIAFIVTGEKLRFTIDTTAADRAGLRISAQLQKLAHRVRRAP
jgi:hypothetical protein